MRFDSYHPAINFIYFTAAIGFCIWFDHPVFAAISWICAFVYSVGLNGKKALAFDLCLIPLMLIFTWWYSYYNHFGMTVIGENFTGNHITLESVLCGLDISVRAAAAVMFFSCVLAVVSSDKIVYLFGRISPRLSLFLSILLRTAPRLRQYARRVSLAQAGIGRGPSQGSMPARLINSLRIVSILVTWLTENFIESAMSMKCRGYSLRGRTAFSIYRFDNRDRCFVVTVFLLMTVIMAGRALDQTEVYFDPSIIMTPVTILSPVFYAAYGFFLLLPFILQKAGEIKFNRQRAALR